MANPKLVGVLLVLALSVSYNECDALSRSVKDICWTLKGSVEVRELKGKDVVDYALQYLSGESEVDSSGRRRLKDALDAFMSDQKCSESSIDYITTMGKCNPDQFLEPLTSPALKYAFKCLTPDYIKETLLADIGASESSIAANNKLKAIFDKEFVSDVRAISLMFKRKELVDIKPQWNQFRKPLVQLVERHFKRQGKDLREELEENFSRYIRELIFNPCKTFEDAAGKVLGRIYENPLLMENDFGKILRLLDRDTQMLVFNFNTCRQIGDVNKALRHLMRMDLELDD